MLNCLSVYVPSTKDGVEGEKMQIITKKKNVGRMSEYMDSSRDEWKGFKNDENNDFRRAKAI